MAIHIVERHGRTYEQIVGGAYEPTRLGLSLPALHLALVVVVVAHVVAQTPDVAGEGIEVERIVDAVGVVRKLMHAAHTEHVEAHCRHVAKERHIAWSRKRIGRV